MTYIHVYVYRIHLPVSVTYSGEESSPLIPNTMRGNPFSCFNKVLMLDCHIFSKFLVRKFQEIGSSIYVKSSHCDSSLQIQLVSKWLGLFSTFSYMLLKKKNLWGVEHSRNCSIYMCRENTRVLANTIFDLFIRFAY